MTYKDGPRAERFKVYYSYLPILKIYHLSAEHDYFNLIHIISRFIY